MRTSAHRRASRCRRDVERPQQPYGTGLVLGHKASRQTPRHIVAQTPAEAGRPQPEVHVRDKYARRQPQPTVAHRLPQRTHLSVVPPVEWPRQVAAPGSLRCELVLIAAP